MASSLRPCTLRAAMRLTQRTSQIHHRPSRLLLLQSRTCNALPPPPPPPPPQSRLHTRLYSSSSSPASTATESGVLDPSMTEPEAAIAAVLASADTLSPTTSLLVRDVSGGCGSMYAIDIASPRFRGLGLLAQQRLVTRALGDRVKEWHGVQIRTSVPPDDA